MSQYTELEIKKAFEYRITSADLSQEKIEGFSRYVFMNSPFIKIMTEVFLEKINEIDPLAAEYTTLEKYLFMLNDIIQRSKFSDVEIFQAFSPIFEKLLIKIAHTKQRGLVVQATNILGLLERRKVYDQTYISRLQVEIEMHQDDTEDSKSSTDFLQVSDEASALVLEIQKLEGQNPEEMVTQLKKLQALYQKMLEFHQNGIKRQTQVKSELEAQIYQLETSSILDDEKPIFAQHIKTEVKQEQNTGIKYPYF